MKKLLSLTLLLFVAIPAGRTQVLELNVTATTTSHAFDNDVFASTTDWVWGGFWGATPVESFTADLSAYEKLRLTISAPTGGYFNVQTPPDSTGGYLGFGFSLFSADGWSWTPNDTSLNTTVSFTDFSGSDWDEIDQTLSVSEDGKAIIFAGGVRWYGQGPTFSFTSYTLEADLSVLNGNGFGELLYNPDLGSSFYFQGMFDGELGGDPGPALELVAVPEPSTYAIICGAAAGLLVLFRKKSRRIASKRA